MDRADAGRALKEIRKRRGLSQAEAAEELEISSKGYVSGIETGLMPCSLRLALRIEKWSDGELKAADLCPEAAGFEAVEARA